MGEGETDKETERKIQSETDRKSEMRQRDRQTEAEPHSDRDCIITRFKLAPRRGQSVKVTCTYPLVSMGIGRADVVLWPCLFYC